MRLIRSQDDLKKALQTQIAALGASCAAYDNGAEWEAARLAVAVYLLVHDGGKKDVSILTQLNLRGSLRYVSSAYEISPHNLLASAPLIHVQISGIR